MIDGLRERRHNAPVLGRATDPSLLPRAVAQTRGARRWKARRAVATVAALVLALALPTWTLAAEYEIGPGDVLKVVVLGQAEMTGSFTVGPDGLVGFPILGKVKASENTTL